MEHLLGHSLAASWSFLGFSLFAVSTIRDAQLRKGFHIITEKLQHLWHPLRPSLKSFHALQWCYYASASLCRPMCLEHGWTHHNCNSATVVNHACTCGCDNSMLAQCVIMTSNYTLMLSMAYACRWVLHQLGISNQAGQKAFPAARAEKERSDRKQRQKKERCGLRRQAHTSSAHICSTETAHTSLLQLIN